MKRKEENRSVIEPNCTFFKPNKINVLPSNRVLDRKPDRVTIYKVLIDLTSLIIKAKSELQKLMTKIKQSYDTARFLAKQIMLLR